MALLQLISRHRVTEIENWNDKKLKQCQLSEILWKIFVVNWRYYHIMLTEIKLRVIYSSRHCRNKWTLYFTVVHLCLQVFVNFCIPLLSFYVKYTITFKNMSYIQWGKPINIDQQGYWPPDNTLSVWPPRLSIFILPLCKSAYRNCRICPFIRVFTFEMKNRLVDFD
jgi:hypothetical protein